MNRLEMLKWMYEHCQNRDNAKYHTIVKNVIGDNFYKELDKMGFLNSEYIVTDRYVWLSYLGNEYCKLIFNYDSRRTTKTSY